MTGRSTELHKQTAAVCTNAVPCRAHCMTRGLFCRHPRFPANPVKRFGGNEEDTDLRGNEASRTAETRSVEAVFDEPPAAPAMERAACYGTTDLQIIAFELLR